MDAYGTDYSAYSATSYAATLDGKQGKSLSQDFQPAAKGDGAEDIIV